MGSSICLSDITGEIRSFLERLLFQYLPYDTTVENGTYFPREVNVGMIYMLYFFMQSFSIRMALHGIRR